MLYKKVCNHLSVITEGSAAPGAKHQISTAEKSGGPQNTADSPEEKGFQRCGIFMTRHFTGMSQGAAKHWGRAGKNSYGRRFFPELSIGIADNFYIWRKIIASEL